MKFSIASAWHAVFASLIFLIPASASADLIASLEPSTLTMTVGDSSYFDVFVTGETLTVDSVGGYAITVSDSPGIDFTGVTTATSASNGYIFPTNNGQNVVSTNPNVVYIDSSTIASTNVSSNETYGVGRIFFDAVSTGTYTINFVSSQSQFLQEDLSPIQTTFNGATITIRSAAVPEPTTTLLLILTGVAGLFFARFRRGRLPEPVAG